MLPDTSGRAHPSIPRTWVLLPIVALLAVLLPTAAWTTVNASDSGASVTTDQADYAPGATVTVTGAGFDAGEAVNIVVNDDSSQSWSLNSSPDDPVAGDSGAFAYQFALPSWFVANYSLIATGLQSGRVATTTFTDLSIGTYDQCSNDDGDGYASGDTGCRWTNGNLQSNNSTYAEGDATVQRVWLTGFVAGSSHTVTLRYGTTKQGKHAYDYLTRWDYSENWITEADRCQDITGCVGLPETVLPIPNDANVLVTQPAGRQFVMRGGAMTAVTAPTLTSGTYGGDSETSIVVTFTVNGGLCEANGTCGVALWFGAHVSRSDQWTAANNTTGASTISGSPYHVALAAVDGASVGNRDNQMQANTIVANGTIVIVKDAVPDGAQDFSFNLTNGTSINEAFLLDDDTDLTLPNSQSFSVPPGAYTASELDIPGGWTLTGLVCSDPSNNSTGSTATATATIDLDSAETVTCTFTDTQTAHLTLVKEVINDNGGTAVATDFTLSADGPTPISGAGGADSDVNAGSYALSETTVDGYTPGTWSCEGGAQDGDSVTLDPGESATCTITNDDDTAHLTLVKEVINDNGGTAVATDFTLSADGPTPISGAGGADSDVNAGSYALSETTVDGYAPGEWSCEGGTQDGDSVSLALGESATCTITNDDDTAHLTLVKEVINDNGGTAVATDFTLSADGPTPISGDGGVSSDVNTGSYDLSETTVDGYTASEWSCDGGTQTGSSISLALGQSATCTITNDDNTAHLTLVKEVINDNGGTATATDFTLSADGPTPISGDGGVAADVNAGSYALSETTVDGYTASDWDCDGGTQTGASVSLALGESATCTITNDDNTAHLTLVKKVINDNGGTATETDFTLSADGPTDISGAGGADSDVDAGSYDLSETTLYGYTAGSWSCEGGTQSGASVSLALGESATCTIVNDDQPGTIIVKKITKPLNTGSFAFTTSGTGYAGFTLPGGGQNSQTLNAGTYTVTESTQLGWILTGIGGSTDPYSPYSCTVTGSGGSTGVGNLNTATATINLKNGDTVTCVFENTGRGVTRTQGFWGTHPQLATIAWFGGSAFGHTFPGVANTIGIGDRLICGRPIDTDGKLMGAFWSDISKTSTGAKRSALDQARMQLLQQLIAAELNASAFGSVPSGGSGMFAQWETALCGTNTNAIKTAQQQAASFNSAGDSGAFTPGTSANSKHARTIADIPFWNVIKP